MKRLSIIQETHEAKRNAARATWWRLRVVHLTVVELSNLIGYSAPAIYRLERGYNSRGNAFKTAAWTRYFNALARVAESKGVKGP